VSSRLRGPRERAKRERVES